MKRDSAYLQPQVWPIEQKPEVVQHVTAQNDVRLARRSQDLDSDWLELMDLELKEEGVQMMDAAS